MLSGKDLRVARKGGTWKTCILLLAQTNPNEQNHCPSQCELIMENSQHDALWYDSWTSSWQSWNCCCVSEGTSVLFYDYNANAGADNTKLLENIEAYTTYLLDCSLEALRECSGSGQSAVIRRSADKKRLFQIKIYVQVLMRQDKKKRHKAVVKKVKRLNNDLFTFVIWLLNFSFLIEFVRFELSAFI